MPRAPVTSAATLISASDARPRARDRGRACSCGAASIAPKRWSRGRDSDSSDRFFHIGIDRVSACDGDRSQRADRCGARKGRFTMNDEESLHGQLVGGVDVNGGRDEAHRDSHQATRRTSPRRHSPRDEMHRRRSRFLHSDLRTFRARVWIDSRRRHSHARGDGAAMNPVTNFADYDSIILGGVRSPGVVTFPQAPKRIEGWEQQVPSGAAAVSRFTKISAVIEFDIQIYVWVGEDQSSARPSMALRITKNFESSSRLRSSPCRAPPPPAPLHDRRAVAP